MSSYEIKGLNHNKGGIPLSDKILVYHALNKEYAY